MKIMTIVGTRPEMIRLSEVIKKIDTYFSHVFVHTGQNFDVNLRDKFFIDLDLRQPDYQLNLEEKYVSFDFIGYVIKEISKILEKERPDKVLVLGDTNSAITAYVVRQMGIPLLHMEAGNRCFSEVVPEEVNRRIIDSCSDYLLTYTQRSRENLLMEGYSSKKIVVIGNPITEVLFKHNNLSKEMGRELFIKYKIKEGSYVVATIHRTENVTSEYILNQLVSAVNSVAERYPVILSMHPKFSSMLDKYALILSDKVIKCDPFGFKDFLFLISHAKVVLTDSGTLPEECCILKVPAVLMRDSTERPELLENNSMTLSGTNADAIINSIEVACGLQIGDMPIDYRDLNVSDKIIKLLCK